MVVQEDVINLATYKLLHSKWKKATCLDRPDKPWHPDIAWAWRQMTKYERSWYILYIMAELYGDWEALREICKDPITYAKVYENIYEASNSYHRDLVGLSEKDHKKRDRDTERRNAEHRQSDERRSSRYTARDVPWDMAEFDSDEDRPPKPKIKQLKTPIYEGHRNGPVRRRTAAQYEAEKRPLSARRTHSAV